MEQPDNKERVVRTSDSILRQFLQHINITPLRMARRILEKLAQFIHYQEGAGITSRPPYFGEVSDRLNHTTRVQAITGPMTLQEGRKIPTGGCKFPVLDQGKR